MYVIMNDERTNVGIEAAREVAMLADVIVRCQEGVDDPTVRGIAMRIRSLGNTLVELVSDAGVPTGDLHERVTGYPMAEEKAQAEGVAQ